MDLATGELFCSDLTTRPLKDAGIILVTGATGYIGGRLVPELLSRNYRVRVMIRSSSSGIAERWPDAEVVCADADRPEQLMEALKGVVVAYYLIHSLNLGTRKFESVDLKVAENFKAAAEKNGLKRIIYLSGLGLVNTKLSPHLKNRIQVADKLLEGQVPVTVLRAGMIVGSGSASYEILRYLVRNTFIFFIPYWAKTKSQPISIRDVIKYLVGVLELPQTAGHQYDIGGPDIATYDQLLRILAKIQGKRRLFLPGLITYTPLYGYIASLLTPVPGPLTKVLIDGCKNEVICVNNNIRRLLPFEPLSLNEAFARAIKVEESDKMSSRWSDAYPPGFELAVRLPELDPPPRFTSSYCLLTFKDRSVIFRALFRLGGKHGWFNSNWMWRLRGWIDRLLLGVGSSRGRRSNTELRLDDTIDFWRVENIVKDKLLLLRAEMKLPGEAWLEFSIDTYEGLNKLLINAYFRPRGIAGRLYWYFFLPFHGYIFKDLIRQIEKRA